MHNRPTDSHSASLQRSSPIAHSMSRHVFRVPLCHSPDPENGCDVVPEKQWVITSPDVQHGDAFISLWKCSQRLLDTGDIYTNDEIDFALYVGGDIVTGAVLLVHAFPIRHDRFALVPGSELQGPTGCD